MSTGPRSDGLTVDAAANAAAAATAAGAATLAFTAAAASAPALTAAAGRDPPHRAGSDEEEPTASEAARLSAAADAAAAEVDQARRDVGSFGGHTDAQVIGELARDLAAANARLEALGDKNVDDRLGADGEGTHGPPPPGARLTVGPPGGRAARTDDAGDRDARDRYDDGFDRVELPDGPDDVLNGFSIPLCVQRRDGLPVPFAPEDTRHASTFPGSSRDEHEARAWYQSLAWLEQHANVLQTLLYSDKEVDDAQLAALLLSARRIYSLGAARYDFLALRQSEPGLADAFAHATAVPRNTLRGSSAREFLARVSRAEVHASAKIGAAARGFRAPPRDAIAGGGGARRGGSRGGGGGGGNGGGGDAKGRRAPRAAGGSDGGGDTRDAGAAAPKRGARGAPRQ